MAYIRTKAKFRFVKNAVSRIQLPGIKNTWSAKDLYFVANQSGFCPQEIMLHDSSQYGPHLMLRPVTDKAIQNIVEDDWQIIDDDPLDDKWEILDKVPGWYGINVYSHYSQKDFGISRGFSGGSFALNQNQGFTMTTWIPPTNPTEVSDDASLDKIYILLGDSAYGDPDGDTEDRRFYICYDFESNLWYVAPQDDDGPNLTDAYAVFKNPYDYGEGFKQVTLTVIPFKHELIINVGSLKAKSGGDWISVPMPPELYNYSEDDDKCDNPVPILWSDKADFIIYGSGKFMFTWSAMQFPFKDVNEVAIYTDIHYPGYDPAVKNKDSSGYLPRNEMDKTYIGVSWPEHLDDDPPEGAGVTYCYRVKTELKGFRDVGDPNHNDDYNGFTPFLESIEISSPKVYLAPVASLNEIDTNTLEITEEASATLRGEFERHSVDALIWTIGDAEYYGVGDKNHRFELRVGSNEIDYLLRGVFSINRKELAYPDFNKGYISFSASQEAVKRCRNTKLITMETYDGATHAHAMEDLANLANADINIPDYGEDYPVLPSPKGRGVKTGYDGNKMWKPSRGNSVWDYMQVIRRFSGWILYPNRNGVLQYKKQPQIGVTDPVYAFRTVRAPDSLDIMISNLRYSQDDEYRTRIIVMGYADHNSDLRGPVPGWPYAELVNSYKKGDNIAAKYEDLDLEADLGETRWVFYHEPQIGNYAALAYATNAIAKWVTRPRIIVNFDVPEAWKILELDLWDIITLDDPRVNGMPDTFQVIGWKYTYSDFNIKATITAIG